MSTIKIKSREEILELLIDNPEWCGGGVGLSLIWMNRKRPVMFIEPMLKYCGCRIPVEDRQSGYSASQGYDYSDKVEKFYWLKEWVDRR